MEIIETIKSMNWQTLIAIFAVNWWFYRELKSDIAKLDERLFYLSTGKTLSQAILDQKLRELS